LRSNDARGRFAGRVRAGSRVLWRVLRVALLPIGLLVFLFLAWPMDTGRYLHVERSGELLDHSGTLLYAFLNEAEQWCFPRGLEDFSPRLIQATLAAEDERFYWHPGVDPLAIVRAAWQNLAGRRVVSGASTLTMQVVKQGDRSHRTVPPHLPRSWQGKLVQAGCALRLELRCNKDAILRTYLNLAPYGLNVIGAEAAARRYFGKPARELTLSEAALLAGLPKAPTALMPLKHRDRAIERRDYVLRRMRACGFISEAECRRACAAALGATWHEFPKRSPHLAMRLSPAVKAQGRVRLTLDAKTQAMAKRLVEKSMVRHRPEITNAAVIVIDVPDAGLLARVGSAGFFTAPGGQVDVCRASRSPGSALKPFTYALAMERNVLYACETLLDDSLDYGMYSPGNYDGKYNGLVSASDALQYSLNVPAVTVLGRVGADDLYAFLRAAGLTTLTRRPDDYGLGLTLGNCEVRLDQLAAAYCMVANLGHYRPLNVRADRTMSSVSGGARCLSRGTCLALFEMLEQTLPEEPEAGLVRAIGVAPRVCWKTGTSTGHHDAWAVVFNRQYVVAVWLGNSDARPSNRLVGIEVALPLAAKVFRALPTRNAPAWPQRGDDLRPVRVCAVSGLPASRWCPETKEVWLPRDQYLNRTCDVHCPSRDAGPRNGVVERWPGSAKGWDLAAVAPSPDLVDGPHEPSKPRRQAVRILEPADRAEFVLTGEPGGDRITLRASLDRETCLHWYLDERYLGASNPARPLHLDLAWGCHTLTCMTTCGALDTVTFDVVQADSSVRLAAR